MPGFPTRLGIPEGLALAIATLNRATLYGDFDDARMCLAQISEKLAGRNLVLLQSAADRLARVLGRRGTKQPGKELGHALVEVTEALERLPGYPT